MIPFPTGTVTFLFTDIEGSTKLWEEYPDAMKIALARHDTLLQQALESHNGCVFKTVGDAFCAAFATAPDALNAALSAQRVILSEDWGETPIRVRIALHTGMAEERDGDYFGPPLNRVARLLSAGYGGQTLLSLATQELVRDQLPQGASLIDLGQHRLKDLFRPEHVYQLAASDLPTEFPPLKTLDTKLTNLPAQPTPLVGREREVAAILALLRRDDVRLVTLTGPGGTGKTRLSLQAAADLLDEYEHGVWFVDLSPITNPDLVVSTIASVLGVKESGGTPLAETLKGYLHDRQLLLVLDNFEQVVKSAPVVADLLAASSKLKVIVTSREVLRLRGEHDYAIPPLGLPERGRKQTVAVLSQYEAVALFIQRAKAANQNFEVTDDNAPAVAEVCVRLDGLPLAIEIAAARARMLTPQKMLEKLSDRLKALTGGPRDLPARQQTIRSTIDWSYHLLDEDEKTLFARLGVFVGGWTLEAAEAVCGEGLGSDVADDLESLLDKSLIRQVEGASGEPRFLILETIREYAFTKLAEIGELEDFRNHHLEYFLALAQRAEPQLTGLNQVQWLLLLENDLDNLRGALDWSLGRNVVAGVQLACSLKWFWLHHLGDGHERFVRLLKQPNIPPQLRADALISALLAAVSFDRAYDVIEESLTLYQELGDQRGVGYSLNLKGVMICLEGDFPYGWTLMAESLALLRNMKDKLAVAEVIAYSSHFMDMSNHERAHAHLEEGLLLSRELGHLLLIKRCLNGLAELDLQYSDYESARLRLEEANLIGTSLSKRGDPDTLRLLGEIALRQKSYEQAAKYLEEAIAVGQQTGEMWVNFWVFVRLAYVALQSGDMERAYAIFSESVKRFQNVDDKDGITFAIEGLSSLAAFKHQPERAAMLFAWADKMREAMHNSRPPVEQADVDRDLATIHTQIDAAAFEKAQAEGRSMTLDEAIAYALETDEQT